MGREYTKDEVQRHNTADSCWVILYGKVYDVTSFLPEHPGGSSIILKLAGLDATESYDPVHPPGTLEESLPSSACLGTIDVSTMPKKPHLASTSSTDQRPEEGEERSPPPLSSILNLHEIELEAKKRLSRKAWAYYYSAADDLRSKHLNNTVYSSILLRPRIFVDCRRCSLATKLLATSMTSGSNDVSSTAGTHRGIPVASPIYVSPAAMARLAHTAGEQGIAQACAKFGTVQIISNNASMTPEQIVEGAPVAGAGEQVFGWQLYVQVDRARSEKMLARIERLRPRVKFVVLTLDAPVPGKREDDEREALVGQNLPVSSAVREEKKMASVGHVPAEVVQGAAKDEVLGGEEKGRKEEGSRKHDGGGSGGGGGVGKSLFAGTAADLTWGTTLPWLTKHTSLPIVLKGVQTHEDAAIAAAHYPTVRGIILSNHGGRAADTAPPAVHTLLEIRKYCPWVFDRIDVWIDGGIKRGTDVVKALCLGAKAVGIGRAALFGLGLGGPEGVERVLEILNDELATAMRLLGVERVEDLGMQHINARAVWQQIYDGPSNLPVDERLLAKL